MPKPSLLLITPARLPYSFTRIGRALLGRLDFWFELHQYAFDAPEAEENLTWRQYPNPGVATDPFGLTLLPEVIERTRPDAILTINDLLFYAMHRRTLNAARARSRVILYCPIDGTPLVRGRSAAFLGLDSLVLFADFAKTTVLADWDATTQDEPPFRLEVIPHGVDLKTFYPLRGDGADGPVSARIAVRRALMPDREDLDDALIILNANQNNPRKRYDLTLKGFATFLRDAPSPTYLWLHCNLHGPFQALWPQVEALGIEDRVLVTTHSPQGAFLSDANLNRLYNACDIGLNTSTGEGWGLVAFEHGAVGAAQIMPNHSACAALWTGSAMMLDTVPVPLRRIDLTQHHVTTPEAVNAALHALASDRYRLADYGRHARKITQQPEYNWDHIALRWRDLITRLLA